MGQSSPTRPGQPNLGTVPNMPQAQSGPMPMPTGGGVAPPALPPMMHPMPVTAGSPPVNEGGGLTSDPVTVGARGGPMARPPMPGGTLMPSAQGGPAPAPPQPPAPPLPAGPGGMQRPNPAMYARGLARMA